MSADEKELPWLSKRLRDLRDAWHRNEKATCGEDEYARILAARDSAILSLRDRVDPLVAEARTRGFVYFRTMRDMGSRSDAIRLQFADGKGLFYERSLGIERLAVKVGLPPTWYRELEPAIHGYVRSLHDIRMLRHGMQVTRVRANVAPK